MNTHYAVICRDGPDAATLRAEHLQAHLAYAESVIDKIAVGGPFREGDSFLGSLMVLKVESEAEARAIMEADPYYRAGVWSDVQFQPFRAVIGDWIGGKIW